MIAQVWEGPEREAWPGQPTRAMDGPGRRKEPYPAMGPAALPEAVALWWEEGRPVVVALEGPVRPLVEQGQWAVLGVSDRRADSCPAARFLEAQPAAVS
jgi:hypothetical protein